MRPTRTLAAFALASAATSAQAQAAGSLLEYRAPSSCPSEAAFAERVSSRLSGTSQPREIGRLPFRVTVGPHEQGFVGELSSSETSTARTVLGDTCSEVVDALSLVAALALVRRAEQTTASSAIAPVLPVAPAAEPPPAEPHAALTAERSPPQERTHASAEAPGPKPPASGLRVGGGAGVISALGITPSPLLGPTAFVELAFGPAAAASVRVGVARAVSTTVHAENGGAARFTWTAAVADACPLAVAFGRVELAPCARVAMGELAGHGTDVAHPQDDARFWVDAGATLRMRVQLISPLSVNLQTGAFVPISRPEFRFETPQTTVASPAIVGNASSLELECRFP